MDGVEEAIVAIVEAVISVIKIFLFIATIPLVMVYLFFRYRLEAKLRKEGKI